jgi:hypothetical protein
MVKKRGNNFLKISNPKERGYQEGRVPPWIDRAIGKQLCRSGSSNYDDNVMLKGFCCLSAVTGCPIYRDSCPPPQVAGPSRQEKTKNLQGVPQDKGGPAA